MVLLLIESESRKKLSIYCWLGFSDSMVCIGRCFGILTGWLRTLLLMRYIPVEDDFEIEVVCETLKRERYGLGEEDDRLL